MAAERKIVDWITINHKHVPIHEGESKQDVVNRVVAKDFDKMRVLYFNIKGGFYYAST